MALRRPPGTGGQPWLSRRSGSKLERGETRTETSPATERTLQGEPSRFEMLAASNPGETCPLASHCGIALRVRRRGPRYPGKSGGTVSGAVRSALGRRGMGNGFRYQRSIVVGRSRRDHLRRNRPCRRADGPRAGAGSARGHGSDRSLPRELPVHGAAVIR